MRENINKNIQPYKWLPKILSDDEMLKQNAFKRFVNDFKPGNVRLGGLRVIFNRDYSLTFKHLITEGQELNRVHSISRCQRIPWIKAIIENANTSRVNYWIEVEGGTRVHYLALPDFSYLVVLKSNNLETVGLSTAFYIDIQSRNILADRFNNYKNKKRSYLVKTKTQQKNISRFDKCFSLKMQGYTEEEISRVAKIPLKEVLRLLKRLS